MSSQTPDSVKAELDLRVAEANATVQDAVDALTDGTTDFSSITITNTASTTATLASLTGISSLSGTADLTLTLAAGAAASFTTVGFVRISLVDSGGNITDGDYYLPFGTLA